MIKQADLLLAQYWFGDRFDDENKARNVDYYERRTVRDSSLSAAVQAVTAAEVGHLELAYDYVYEAAQIDLRDLDHNSGDGMHIASLASVWTALVDSWFARVSGSVVVRPAASRPHHPAVLQRAMARPTAGSRHRAGPGDL